MKPKPTRRNRYKASSLVTTLLVLVVLSTIVVAFMQSMSIERLVSRSAISMARAKLAAESGLNVCLQQLSTGVGSNAAYVVGELRDSAGLGSVLVIGQTNLTNTAELMPLLSGNLSLLNGYPASTSSNSVMSFVNARTNLSSTSSVNVNLMNKLIQSTSDTNAFRAPWVYVTDAAGRTNARYAYIVVDEWARVNPRFHGGQSSRGNATNWFPGTDTLPLVTGGTNLLTDAQATNARALTNWMYTPHSVGQAFASSADYQARKHLLTFDDTWSPDVIPAGLPQGGRPKYNINDLATNTAFGATATLRAENIAGIIASNLPIFGKRDLGLQLEDPSGLKYLTRLAANIVDYIDADGSPTTVNGGEPAGKELTPYVVVVAERNTWTSKTGSGGPPYTVTITSEFFAQLWNPYTVEVSGDAQLEIFNRQFLDMPGGGAGADLQDYTSAKRNVTLRPNEFKAVKFGQTQQVFVNNVSDPSVAANNPKWEQTSSSSASLYGHPQFRLLWNEEIVDMNRSSNPGPMSDPATAGLPRNPTTFSNVGFVKWSIGYLPSNSPNTVADPRITWLCQSDWAIAYTYNNPVWQGRQGNTSGRSQDFNTTWASRDFVPRSPVNTGSALGSISGDPETLTSRYDLSDSNSAVAYIRNQPMTSIGELAHIFDPIQVNNTGGNALDTDNKYYRPGGGYSLRIGQPEFAYTNMSTNGGRAIELLDLFTVNTTNSTATNYPSTRGRINVNTASRAVVEALFYGITPKMDASITNATISAINASNIANLLISNRPYNRLSDLYKITPALANSTNYTPNLSVNTALGVAGVFDRAREEAFGKMVGLATVQSRAFRVYVVGQSLGPNLKQQGQVVLEASLSIQTGPSGNLYPKVSYIRWEN